MNFAGVLPLRLRVLPMSSPPSGFWYFCNLYIPCIAILIIVMPSFIHTAYMKGVPTFQFSDEGSNLLPAEKQAYINYFVDFLDEWEG